MKAFSIKKITVMGYIIEYRDEEYQEAVRKLKEAKKALKEACEILEEGGQENDMEERRGNMRDNDSESWARRGMSRRGGRFGY